LHPRQAQPAEQEETEDQQETTENVQKDHHKKRGQVTISLDYFERNPRRAVSARGDLGVALWESQPENQAARAAKPREEEKEHAREQEKEDQV
jgi:hypothetical protein